MTHTSKSDGGLYTSLQKLTGEMEKNSHRNRQMGQRFINMQHRMGGIGNVAQEEYGESIGSVVRRFDARCEENAKDHATSSGVEVKSEVKPEVPPCLNIMGDDRNLGVRAKTEPPPVTKTEHKMDMDTNSISTEKGNPPNN